MPRLQAASDVPEQEDVVEANETSRSQRQRRSTISKHINLAESNSDMEDSSENDDADEGPDTTIEGEAQDSDSPLSSPPPESPPKKKIGRPKKSIGATPDDATPAVASSTTKVQSETPLKKRRMGNGKGGGNKRKHAHEYCLTCSHYGRACSGRRDDHPGCAVCREPDRSKGEKLRECLWAEPEKGIFTYLQAKEVLKVAQAQERAQQGKPPTKRMIPFLTKDQKEQYLNMADPTGLAEPRPRTYSTAPPPISRPLNVLPPPSATNNKRYLAGIELHAMSADQARQLVAQEDAMYMHRMGDSRPPQAPRLFVERGSLEDLPQAPPASALPFPKRMASQPLIDSTGRRIPYYDANLQAYVLPAWPHSNLLPPHMQGKTPNEGFVSVYDAYPFLPVVMPDPQLQRSARPNFDQPQRRPSLNSAQNSSPRPLDKTGTPTRRYERSDSIASNVSGYPVAMKVWQSPAKTTGQLESDIVAKATTNGIELSVTGAVDPRRNSASLSTTSEVSDRIAQDTKTPFPYITVVRGSPPKKAQSVASSSVSADLEAGTQARRRNQVEADVPSTKVFVAAGSAPNGVTPDPIDEEDQPQISRSGSLSPTEEYHDPAESAANIIDKPMDPNRKRKRPSRPTSPEAERESTVPEDTIVVVKSVEHNEPGAANGKINTDKFVSQKKSARPSPGRFSIPPIAEARRRPSSSSSSLSATSPPVTTSGWQAVNTVKKPSAVTAVADDTVAVKTPLVSVRGRKKRRTGVFDIPEDK